MKTILNGRVAQVEKSISNLELGSEGIIGDIAIGKKR